MQLNLLTSKANTAIDTQLVSYTDDLRHWAVRIIKSISIFMLGCKNFELSRQSVNNLLSIQSHSESWLWSALESESVPILHKLWWELKVSSPLCCREEKGKPTSGDLTRKRDMPTKHPGPAIPWSIRVSIMSGRSNSDFLTGWRERERLSQVYSQLFQ